MLHQPGELVSDPGETTDGATATRTDAADGRTARRTAWLAPTFRSRGSGLLSPPKRPMTDTTILTDFIGRTFDKIEGAEKDSDEILFYENGTARVRMYHDQDCCESVLVDDIDGDPDILVGTPILEAEETGREAEEGECCESGTWTFYKFRTAKGWLTLKWFGESSGYYSESVDIQVLP